MKTFSKAMRNVVVSDDLMNKITAMCDVLIAEGRNDAVGKTAKEIPRK